uniref:Uncharacterized protein n=1 Tax=Leersia perrieri TaxID=77586 RepID=A0A0D9WMI9_9ORYZ
MAFLGHGLDKRAVDVAGRRQPVHADADDPAAAAAAVAAACPVTSGLTVLDRHPSSSPSAPLLQLLTPRHRWSSRAKTSSRVD